MRSPHWQSLQLLLLNANFLHPVALHIFIFRYLGVKHGHLLLSQIHLHVIILLTRAVSLHPRALIYDTHQPGLKNQLKLFNLPNGLSETCKMTLGLSKKMRKSLLASTSILSLSATARTVSPKGLRQDLLRLRQQMWRRIKNIEPGTTTEILTLGTLLVGASTSQ